MSKRTSSLVWSLVLISGVGLTAQTVRRVPPPRSTVTLIEPWRPNNTGDTKIVGTVIDIRQMPVAYARVQLRNLVTGQIAQTGESNDHGDYEFIVDEPSTYVVEMVLVDGYVIALSNAASLSRYETQQTVIQLPGRWDAASSRLITPQNLGTYFGASGANTMTNTTLEMAIDQNVTPADPGEPVSPNR